MASAHAYFRPLWILKVSIALLVALTIGEKNAFAQSIVPANDGTGTIVSPDGNTFNITGGRLSADQANLFHSFQKFGLNPDQIAHFLSQPQIRNILGRVVGGDPSVIQGLIRVTGGNTNLYLVNPAGIVFGPTARLDVPANFAATTATSIQFDREFFNSLGSNNYSALTGDPNSYVFSGANGDIINAGDLSLSPGQVLTLIANTVTNTGNIKAPGGQVILASMPKPGVVRLSQPGGVLSVEYQFDPSSANSAVSVADLGKLLNKTQNYDLGFTLNADGSIQLNVSPVKILPTSGTTIASGNIDVSRTDVPNQTGGQASILGNAVVVAGANLNASGSNGGGVVLVGGDFQGKGTTPTAQNTFVDSHSTINVNAVNQGNGGKAVVWSDQATIFNGKITAQGGATAGNGGSVEVSGKQNLALNGTIDASAPQGTPGSILLDPQDINIVPNTSTSPFPFTSGADDSQVTSDGQVLFADGGSANFTISDRSLTGFSGNISLQANQDITAQSGTNLTFTNFGQSVTFNANRNITLNSALKTNGGAVTLTAGQNLITQGINTQSLSSLPSGVVNLTATNGNITLNGGINTSSVSSFGGNGGAITLTSGGTIDASGEKSFTLNNDVNNLGNRYTLDSHSLNGSGGAVTLKAGGDINLGLINTNGGISGGTIDVNSTGGQVNAIVPQVAIKVGSTTGTVDVGLLDASGNQRSGGTVTLQAANGIQVGSIISGSVKGSGGNVTLTTTNGGVTALSTGTLSNGSTSKTLQAGGIATGSTSTGQGGNISITAPGDIRTGWLLTASPGGTTFSGSPGIPGSSSSSTSGGGNVKLTSTGGNIDTTINVNGVDVGLLQSLGLNATQAALASQAGTNLGLIITGSQNGNGGSVDLTASGNISTGAIISGSQNGTGGAITLTSNNGSIDISNDRFFSGLTRDAWLEGAKAGGLSPSSTVNFSTLGIGSGVYTVDQLATWLDGVSFRLGIISGSQNGTGGAVKLSAPGNITTSNIVTTSLNRNSGNIDITSSNGSINGSDAVLFSNLNQNLLRAFGLGQTTSTALSYLSSPSVAFGGYITLSLSGNAGNITLKAAGDVSTNYLATSSFSGKGGAISVTSGGKVTVGRLLSNIANGIFPTEFSNLTNSTANKLAQLIAQGNLSSAGATGGGGITVQAKTSITTGAVNSSSTSGSGGNVVLDPQGDVQVYSINTQGGTSLASSSSSSSSSSSLPNSSGSSSSSSSSQNPTGGSVTIATQSNFRATGSFVDQNGITASISTAAPGGGGRISISNGGGGRTAFKLGDASVNGTAAAITSGNFTIFPAGFDANSAARLTKGNPFFIAPAQGYLFTQRFPGLDNGYNSATGAIGLFSVDPPVCDQPGSCQPPPPNCQELGNCPTPPTPTQKQSYSIDQARDILALVEQRSGVKPALIYVSFESPDFQLQPVADQFSHNESQFSDQYENYLNVPHRIPGPALKLHPSDRDTLRLLVVTANEDPILISVPNATRDRVVFAGAQLLQSILEQEPEGVYLRSSKQLYQQLIAPIDKILEERKVQNLAFVMDNSLRLLPLAALNDGEHYLIEKYSVGLMPSLSLTDTRFVDIKSVSLLAMGADTFSDEAALPAVPAELGIVSKLWNANQPLINDRFTLDNLRSARSNQRFGILHLATHGDFNAGSINQSYIRFGDKRVTLDQLRTLHLDNPTVELMVLSACRTAVGNPNAELGFAGLAHQAGVKTALGSLWYVGDEATLGLMTSFYENLRKAPIKAEALRQAQLAMLRGQINIGQDTLHTPTGDFPIGDKLGKQQGIANLRHPYAWSAFTMIGSPW